VKALWMILRGRGGSDTLGVWWRNAKTEHHRWMMRYLRKRGWVVFYLPEESRKCTGQCWMDLYNSNHRGNL
jgi:hypothetical protein